MNTRFPLGVGDGRTEVMAACTALIEKRLRTKDEEEKREIDEEARRLTLILYEQKGV